MVIVLGVNGAFKVQFIQKIELAQNVLILGPCKMEMSLFLHQIWINLDYFDVPIHSAVDGCHQNGVQTADKNITIVHK